MVKTIIVNGYTLSKNEIVMWSKLLNKLGMSVSYYDLAGIRKVYENGMLKNVHGVGKKTTKMLCNIFNHIEQPEHMTNEEYNKAEGVRRSDLWKISDSPEKYKYFKDNPPEQTPAMAFGSAIHKLILEPDTFFDEYAVAPEINRRTNDGKAQWEKFVSDNAGKTIITADDYNTMKEMETKLKTVSLARSLLYEDGKSEVPVFWTDPETGEKCKAKLDRLDIGLDGRYYIVDYKSALSAETFRFNSEIFKLGYHVQSGMYSEGTQIAYNLDYRPVFLFVVQEKKPPYAVNVIEVTDEVADAGNAQYHLLLGKLHDCKAVDIFPGYVGDVPNDSFVPGWMSSMLEEEISE